MDSPNEHLCDELVTAVRDLIARDRQTADVWEQQNNETYWPRTPKESVAGPPERSRQAIKNWINWLRHRADELDALLVQAQGRRTGQKVE